MTCVEGIVFRFLSIFDVVSVTDDTVTDTVTEYVCVLIFMTIMIMMRMIYVMAVSRTNMVLRI